MTGPDVLTALISPTTQADLDAAREWKGVWGSFAHRLPEEDLAYALARHRVAALSTTDNRAPVSAPAGEGEDWHDVMTHRSNWREAIILARDVASERSDHPEADRSYWNHELRAFDRTFTRLAALAASDRAPVSTPAGEGEACRFIGVSYTARDLEIAQRAACAIVPFYGDGAPGEQEAAREGKLWNDHSAVQGALRALYEASVAGDAAPAQPATGTDEGLRAALPSDIGRLHLGERQSDGERLCSHGHAVPAGHPLYWPERMGEYPDDIDPLCLAHAIEQAVDDNGWCEICTGAALSADNRAPVEDGWRDVSMHDDQPFIDAWRLMEAKGYMYGEDALENVHLGWQLARAADAPTPPTDSRETGA